MRIRRCIEINNSGLLCGIAEWRSEGVRTHPRIWTWCGHERTVPWISRLRSEEPITCVRCLAAESMTVVASST